MHSLSQKLFCEVEFRDFMSGEKITIAGKIDLDKLISPNFKNIIVENYSFVNYHWKKVENQVYKVDVIRITLIRLISLMCFVLKCLLQGAGLLIRPQKLGV